MKTREVEEETPWVIPQPCFLLLPIVVGSSLCLFSFFPFSLRANRFRLLSQSDTQTSTDQRAEFGEGFHHGSARTTPIAEDRDTPQQIVSAFATLADQGLLHHRVSGVEDRQRESLIHHSRKIRSTKEEKGCFHGMVSSMPQFSWARETDGSFRPPMSLLGPQTLWKMPSSC